MTPRPASMSAYSPVPEQLDSLWSTPVSFKMNAPWSRCACSPQPAIAVARAATATNALHLVLMSPPAPRCRRDNGRGLFRSKRPSSGGRRSRYFRSMTARSTRSSLQPPRPQANANTETVALPPANLPLALLTSAVHGWVVPSHANSAPPPPADLKRPTDGDSWTPILPAPSPPVQVMTPVMVADPVQALKCPVGSTVNSTTGGGGSSATVMLSVPPLPAPASKSKARIK